MSQAERKPQEFLRNSDNYTVYDALNYARNIMRASTTPGTDREDASTSWVRSGCRYYLWASNWQTHRPEYMLACDDITLGVMRTYAFADKKNNLIVRDPDKNVELNGDPDSYVPELMSHLGTNEHGFRKPVINPEGNHMFERIAARYALSELEVSPIAKYLGTIEQIDPAIRKEEVKKDIVEAITEQGLEIDGEVYPYTRSSLLARLMLSNYIIAQRKQGNSR